MTLDEWIGPSWLVLAGFVVALLGLLFSIQNSRRAFRLFREQNPDLTDEQAAAIWKNRQRW